MEKSRQCRTLPELDPRSTAELSGFSGCYNRFGYSAYITPAANPSLFQIIVFAVFPAHEGDDALQRYPAERVGRHGDGSPVDKKGAGEVRIPFQSQVCQAEAASQLNSGVRIKNME
jgi:hypothetical protein